MERRDGEGLDQLHAAIQTFSNGLADDETQVGMVTQALVVWEEVTFDNETGVVLRETIYAATGDQATPNGSLGLSLHLLTTLKRDVIGFE